MTINETLDKAKHVITYLSAIEAKGNTAAKHTNAVIKGLIDIIYWYDKNQRNLIKGVSNLAKENRKLKEAIAEYVIQKYGGDDDDAA